RSGVRSHVSRFTHHASGRDIPPKNRTVPSEAEPILCSTPCLPGFARAGRVSVVRIVRITRIESRIQKREPSPKPIRDALQALPGTGTLELLVHTDDGLTGRAKS